MSPGLLVSVRNLSEAQRARAAGVDVIDLKEPAQGALAPVPVAVALQIASTLARPPILSLALGELNDADHTRIAQQWLAIPQALSAFHFAKRGLAGCGEQPDWPARWDAWASALPPSVLPVVVTYADAAAAGAPPVDTVLDWAISRGRCGVLIDTFGKRQGNLFSWLTLDQARTQIRRCRRANLPVVLAGSLDLKAISLAAQLSPHWIGIRGAACAGNRSASLDAASLERVVAAMHTPHQAAAPLA